MVLPFHARSPHRVVVAGVAAFFFLLLLLLASGHTGSYFPTWPAARVPNSSSKNAIPNQVHYVYVLEDPTKDFSFQFSRKFTAASLVF